jgi:molybdopterin-binding protein
MELSARNQSSGTVTAIKLGGVMAEIIGGNEVVSVITPSSAERLGLKPGDQVTVIITRYAAVWRTTIPSALIRHASTPYFC